MGRIISDKSLIRKRKALLRKILINPEESTKRIQEGKRRIKRYDSCFQKGEWDQRRKSLIQKKNVVKKEAELI